MASLTRCLSPHLLQHPQHSPSPHHLVYSELTFKSPCQPLPNLSLRNTTTTTTIASVFSIPLRLYCSRGKCFTKSTKEDSEILTSDGDEATEERASIVTASGTVGSQRVASTGDSISLGIREPVYEVIEVKSNGMISTRKINRRELLKSGGLRPRDIRSVDPSLWLTNSMPSLLVRDHAILLNMGSLRAIAMQESVFIFNYNRKGGRAFLDLLLPRLNPKNMNGGPSMPFELEVVEAALLSRVQRYERRLMDLEPRVSM